MRISATLLAGLLLGVAASAAQAQIQADAEQAAYFPPPESQGGWRTLEGAEDIRRVGEMDPQKLEELREWLLQSDKRTFAATFIRHGYIVLEVERGNSAATDARRVASCSKAICATVLAIASEQSQQANRSIVHLEPDRLSSK